jgi:hypothetical protein
MTQLDSTVISALRTVLDDVCSHLPLSSVSLRTEVASRILQCAHGGEQTYDELREAGLQALRAGAASGDDVCIGHFGMQHCPLCEHDNYYGEPVSTTQ